MQEGKIGFDIGEFFTKGQFMGTGQANVKAYNRELGGLIHDGKARPSWSSLTTSPSTEARRLPALR